MNMSKKGRAKGGTTRLFPGLVIFLFLFSFYCKGAPWVASGTLAVARGAHTATLLSDGRVLIAGGNGAFGGYINSAELYDTATGSSKLTSVMSSARAWHTATLLTNGEVLIVGGFDGNNYLASTEIYDPLNATWRTNSSLNEGRAYHTATLLNDGRVLVAGGMNAASSSQFLTSCEIFDPTSGAWTIVGSLNTNRSSATATLLPNGQVLVAGGYNSNAILSAELFDPVSQTWTLTGPMTTARYYATATLLSNGKVFVAGGRGTNSLPNKSAELFDPATGAWTSTGSMSVGRYNHSVVLLPDGEVMAIAGSAATVGPTNTVEIYNPDSGTWRTTTSTIYWGGLQTATLLPGGRVLDVIGNTTEILDASIGTVQDTGGMGYARSGHRATLLLDGKVLVFGGMGAASTNAELYDPANGSWTAAGKANYFHGVGPTATLLRDGRVLVAGGSAQNTGAEIYDPNTGMWTITGSLNYPRYNHAATLLPNGEVMVVGSFFAPGATNAEIYDPNSGAWTVVDSPNLAFLAPSSVLLTNGSMLVVGGVNSQLYDPVLGTWTTTGRLANSRSACSAVLLTSGKVLVAGGGPGLTELYDPTTGRWTSGHTVTNGPNPSVQNTALMPDGRVVFAGDAYSYGAINVVDVYDPSTGLILPATPLNAAVTGDSVTLLPNGNLLIAGGSGSGPALTNAEIYSLYSSNAMAPQIYSMPSEIQLGENLAVSGTNFAGVSEASGGNNCQDSSTDFPILGLRNMESGQSVFLPITNWTADSLVTLPLTAFSPGHVLATVFVNGVPGASRLVFVEPPVLQNTVLSNPSRASDGHFGFTFTNSIGGRFGVLASTDLSLPLTHWTKLGGVMEITPGQFQFLDSQATNMEQRFYQLYAP